MDANISWAIGASHGDMTFDFDTPLDQLPNTTSQQSRKRPRSDSPGPSSSRRATTNNMNTSSSSFSLMMGDEESIVNQLKTPKTVDQALNSLMKTTASHEINYTLNEDEPLLQNLVHIIEYDKGESNVFQSIGDLVPDRAWNLIPKQPTFPLTTIPRLHAVLMILRNLSFVAANLRPMSQELSVMKLLTDCLYLQNADVLLVHAVFTLSNLASVLDVTGQRLLADQLFVDTSKELHKLGFGGLLFAKQLDDTHQVSVDKDVLWEGTHKYVTQIWQLFGALHHIVVSPQTPRPVFLMTLDWIKELLEHHTPSADVPSMHDIFRAMPTDMTQRLVDCLWIPRLGPDAMDYVNPITNLVSRVSTLKLFMGYDATVDTELRDRALEVITLWLALGSGDETNLNTSGSGGGGGGDGRAVATKMTTLPVSARLYNALVPCLSTTVGRNDVHVFVHDLLKALSLRPEHADGLAYVQTRILELATRGGDGRIAQLALGHLYRTHDDSMDDTTTKHQVLIGLE